MDVGVDARRRDWTRDADDDDPDDDDDDDDAKNHRRETVRWTDRRCARRTDDDAWSLDDREGEPQNDTQKVVRRR